MQVPEKLALIGGSILLSSTLIFTLKSQTSNVLPHVSAQTENVMAGKNVQKERADQQAQAAQQAKVAQQAQQAKEQQVAHDKWWNSLSGFDQGNEIAKQKGWKTGMWGSSKYYIDDHNDMSVGDGKVQGHLADLLGNDSNNIKNVSFAANAQHDADSVLNSNAINQRNQQQAAENSSANNGSSGGSSYVPPSNSGSSSDDGNTNYVAPSDGGNSGNSSGSSSSSSSSSSNNNSDNISWPSPPNIPKGSHAGDVYGNGRYVGDVS